MMKGRLFDVCIIDEAGQVGIAIGKLTRHCRKRTLNRILLFIVAWAPLTELHNAQTYVMLLLLQMVLPAALAPLLKSRSFVLVGDHNQLPPLVINKQAEAGGLGESLFKRLSDAHPQASTGPLLAATCILIMLCPLTRTQFQPGLLLIRVTSRVLVPLQAVVSLPVQYRMAEDIMLLPNTLIYNHALRCGNGGWLNLQGMRECRMYALWQS
jgi:superfamily I DNA and/or RNA helicase